MHAIWNGPHGGLTVREVMDALGPDSDRAYTTVQTMLNGLVGKRLLKRRKDGLAFRYLATRSRESIRAQETGRFVARSFGGSFGALAQFLIGGDRLTDAELRELRVMLDSKPGAPGKRER